MATEIPVTPIVRAGVAPPALTDGDDSNGMFFDNDGTVFLEIVSSDGAPQTVTISAAAGMLTDGLTVEPLVLTIPNGATRYHGPFRPNTFNQTDGTVLVMPSVSTTLKFRGWGLTPSY